MEAQKGGAFILNSYLFGLRAHTHTRTCKHTPHTHTGIHARTHARTHTQRKRAVSITVPVGSDALDPAGRLSGGSPCVTSVESPPPAARDITHSHAPAHTASPEPVHPPQEPGGGRHPAGHTSRPSGASSVSTHVCCISVFVHVARC